MKEMGLYWRHVILALACSRLVFAQEPSSIEKPKFHPVDSLQASWVFSGIVTSESGDDYGYFFQLERDKTHFHVNVALMDQNSKKVLFHDESDAEIENAPPYDWHVGRSFLRFNPINDSWIFGVKPKDNLGFNFKVDMLKQFETPPAYHHLRTGVTMMVSRTSELNGHVSTGDSDTEQFVTTKEAWFRQIWQDENDTKVHPLTSVLCQFNDGSRFYSVNLHEPDAQSGAIAGWYNADGVPQSTSQFIQVSHSKKGGWHIQSPNPRLDLVIPGSPDNASVVAGFVGGTTHPGFCMLNNQEKGQNKATTAIG
jgi:hypothetical protein